MIERCSRDFYQPDETILVIKSERDQWLGSVAPPCPVGYPTRRIFGYEIGREVATDKKDREAGNRGAFRSEVGDDKPTERRPDGLDTQRITGTLNLGAWVFNGDKGHKPGIVRRQNNPDQ